MVIYMGNNIEFIDLMNNAILKDYEKTFKKILKRVKKELNIKGKIGMSVTLCDNNYIQELNKNYRNKDVPTDVLSFAIEDDENEELLMAMKKLSSIREIGDIIISYDKAQSQAEEYGHTLNREMCFLFTHGVLHLLGYDHMNKSDEEEMFGLQKKILADMKIDR
jgi:probable rRNA maturation factor